MEAFMFATGTKLTLRIATAALAAFVLSAPIFSAHADPVADFYKGKRISMMISSGVGGGYDLYARTVSRFMGAHIPGNPSIIPQNKPGAGGMKLLNFAYIKAPRDGSLVFTLHIGLPLHQALGGRGVRYDAKKLIGLGRVAAGNAITGVWHKAAVKSFADARKKTVTVGSTGASSVSSVFPTVAQNVLGAKIKVIMGYKGGEQVMLAMERGEVDGFGAFGLASMQSTRPNYLTKKLVNPLVQWGLRREKIWPDIPLASELAKNAVDKKAVEVLSSQMDFGRSYYLPPGVPRDRVTALRVALKKTIGDAKFLASAKKLKMEIRYASGEATEKMIADVLAAPKSALTRLKEVMVKRGGGKCKEYTSPKFCKKKKKKKRKKKSS
jgi:tripartite-type tricarboxylate transporter receptor subunit TctC